MIYCHFDREVRGRCLGTVAQWSKMPVNKNQGSLTKKTFLLSTGGCQRSPHPGRGAPLDIPGRLRRLLGPILRNSISAENFLEQIFIPKFWTNFRPKNNTYELIPVQVTIILDFEVF
jgi:hypothetical protein